MVACPRCRHDNRPGSSFCRRCGEPLGARPTQVGSLSNFESELIWLVYSGVSEVQQLAQRMRVRHDTMIQSVDDLCVKGLLEKASHFPYTPASLRVHLTPEGYNQAALIARQRPQVAAPAQAVYAQPPQQSAPPSGVQQQVTVRSGWEVCGYACILIIVIFVILLLVARSWLCSLIPMIPGC
jgi:predicted amidophosphoribosyltransferase